MEISQLCQIQKASQSIEKFNIEKLYVLDSLVLKLGRPLDALYEGFSKWLHF
jgi:hypothetical protein